MKLFRSLAIFFLLGLFFTTGIMPGFSHTDTEISREGDTEIYRVTRKHYNLASVNKTQKRSNLVEAQNLVQQGRKYYEAEQFSEAVNNLQQAANTFAALGEEQKEAITRGNLSLAYQQLGNWQEAQTTIAQSLTLLGFNYNLDSPSTWQIPNLSREKQHIIARLLNIYGRLWYVRGQSEWALSSWRLATSISQKLEDKQGILTNQINQVQALQALGLYQEAKKTIESVRQNLDYLPESLKFQGLISLGNILRNVGDLENSDKFLQTSLELAKSLNYLTDVSTSYLSLADTLHVWGNLERERQLPSRYEYIPWRCEINEYPSNLPETAQNFYQEAENNYRQVLEVERSQSSTTAIKAQLNLLRLLIANGKWSEAQKLSKEIKLSQLPNSRTKVYTKINLAKSLACLEQKFSSENNSWNRITRLIETAIQDSEELQDKRAQSYAVGNLGGLYEYFALLTETSVSKQEGRGKREEGYTSSLYLEVQAPSFTTEGVWERYKRILNKKTSSFLRGYLWRFPPEFISPVLPTSSFVVTQHQKQNTQAQQWRQQARQLTQEALYLAQPSEIPDIAYQWQWQLGRLLEAKGNREKSLAHYQAAVETLESVRGDLLAINSDVQFSFRDNVEPVYRQLANLLLKQPLPKNLAQTRQVIQRLQLAELENFLRCNLQNTEAVEIDKIVDRQNSTEAVIYPIILEQQINVILKLPNSNELRYHSTSVSRGEVEEVLQRLQENLAKPQGRKKVQIDAHQVYQWLIAPFLTDLEKAKVDTLVFLLDTPLRNIPMAVLYDGKNYLIEKYAVAVTSGLELREPKTLEREQLNAMLAGLTESRQGYPPLKNVDIQLNQISAEIPSQIFLDREFTVSNFQNQLQSLPFPVVHIATHGQFSSQPEETFIIAWDNRINVNELSNFLKSRQEIESEPIELLVLAACQTAKGDKRATLGLAGVAVNAGARSTLATLWKVVADESPGDLLSQFYRELSENPHLTKAEALRRAQLEFLKDDSRNRPYFWAPYILLGNWL